MILKKCGTIMVIVLIMSFSFILCKSFEAQAASLSWVAGTVDGFTSQQGRGINVTLVGIKTTQGKKYVRFCDSTNGADISLTANNVLYDLLKTAYMKGVSVQVGVYDFGNDPQWGIEKLCIDRVVW